MTTGTNTVCVVVPVYRAEFSRTEQVALDRCIAVLGKHSIVIVKPESLCLNKLFSCHPNLSREEFGDDFFVDVKGYNRLLLEDEFYARFAAYEFILVYQLDAFVFSDQLLSWCSRGYDYIGAPWLPPGRVPGRIRQALIAVRRKCYRLLARRARAKDPEKRPQFAFSAGNGGFSLRRISAMRRVLADLDRRAERYRLAATRGWQEDIFFSIEANRYRTNIRIPNAREAAHFSWETNPGVAAKLTNGELPFGCHGWNKLHRDDWRPIFARLGVSIDSLLEPQAAAN
jgi:hypothetical protein